MNARLLDTNFIVRHLVRDDQVHADIARNLFTASDHGEVLLVALPEVIAETVFVLESYYQHPRQVIADVLSRLLTSPGVEIVNVSFYLQALSLYGSGNLHFIDCVIAAHAQNLNFSVATFDKAFAKLPGVKVDVRS